MEGDTGRLSFQLPELSVAASFRRRVPWSEERPNAAGPEGWLQKTGLLPLHYFVVSGTVRGPVLGREREWWAPLAERLAERCSEEVVVTSRGVVLFSRGVLL